MTRNTRSRKKLERLTALLQPADSMLIVVQEYPDPDAIAAAVALRELANARAAVACTLCHGGATGRAENRALIRYLGVNLRLPEELDPKRFDLIGMVDTQPGTGNNPLATGLTPDIVIDHHPTRRATRKSPFTDIRRRYGATSTILAEYLAAAGIEPSVPLATALVYGIRSDTQDLGREAGQADIDAYLELYPRANARMLSRILQAPVPRSYFQIFARALHRAEVTGTAVLSGLGEIDTPDMVAEVADLLLRNEESTWALCHGCHARRLLLSLRTSDMGADAGAVMRRLVGRKGSGGGHSRYAGGQIPLPEGTDLRKLERVLRKRWQRLVGVADAVPEPLVTLEQQE